MGETISSAMRVGMLTILLAACVVSSTALFTVVNNVYVGYADKMSEALSDAGNSSLAALNQVQRVPAPVVYRIIYQNLDHIDSLSIKWTDGTVTSDYRTLLKNAASFVSATVKNKGNGVSIVEIMELAD